MGYINFKEEKVAALDELKKRKENNNNISIYRYYCGWRSYTIYICGITKC